MTYQTYAIETQGLTRRFGTRVVVDRLDLRVRTGGIYGFLGLNGAGKTTTIRLLLGLIRPDAGAIQIFGKTFEATVLARIGALVETPSLYSHLTGRENLEITRRQIAAPRSSIDRVLAIVRLTGDADRVLGEYSLGMKQRLGLALALLSSPELLILDEPTNGLDPAGIHEVRDLLRRMPTEHGVTVFLSSHLLGEVEQLADSVAIIHQGQMVFQGPLAELRQRRQARLRVGVVDVNAAVESIRALGFDVSAESDGAVVRGSTLDVGQINRLLVQQGHDVFRLSLEEDSLEDLFLGMTGERTSC